MGEPAGDDDGQMNPSAKFSSNHFRRASSSCLDKEYSGPKEGAVPSRSWILWSPGRCGGSLLASISENSVVNSWYSLGISGVLSWPGCSSMASMSAAEMAKVVAASWRRFSFLTVLRNPLRDTAAMSMVLGRGGGMSMVVAFVGRGAQVVVHRGETKSMVSFSQSMRGLWCLSHGIPRTRG